MECVVWALFRSPLPQLGCIAASTALLCTGPTALLNTISTKYFLPNDEVSGLVVWPLGQTPKELTETVRQGSCVHTRILNSQTYDEIASLCHALVKLGFCLVSNQILAGRT